MNQFKAIICCPDCGEIHAEKWVASSNRHASQTVLYTLCQPCQYNELVKFDPFEKHDPYACDCEECNKVWEQVADNMTDAQTPNPFEPNDEHGIMVEKESDVITDVPPPPPIVICP